MEKQTNDMTLSLIVLGAIACLFLFKTLSPFITAESSPSTEQIDESKKVAKLIRSDADWRKMLTADQYKVMRQNGTEPAFSGEYVDFNELGSYLCAGCHLPVFSSADKVVVKTGWASFTKPILPENVIHKHEGIWMWEKVAAHCARCDSHLGSVINNGRPPTGKLYSVDSIALQFEPAPTTR